MDKPDTPSRATQDPSETARGRHPPRTHHQFFPRAQPESWLRFVVGALGVSSPLQPPELFSSPHRPAASRRVRPDHASRAHSAHPNLREPIPSYEDLFSAIEFSKSWCLRLPRPKPIGRLAATNYTGRLALGKAADWGIDAWECRTSRANTGLLSIRMFLPVDAL
jgi:hypothetical protein